MKLENHPCFNEGACSSNGRIHLPVASRCNVQCNFCNRKFDCVNESRPGVTSGILSPDQAICYLENIMAERKDISVVGIAGPGDPFANPFETIRTLELVRERYPDMILCLATNGLNLIPYVNDIARLNVSHVSITVNAVDPETGAKIYAWVRNGKRTEGSEEGAALMLKSQLASISALKEKDVVVKVNSVVIPGINMNHIVEISKKMEEMGVDLFNCMPYYPNKGSNFEHIPEPSTSEMDEIRRDAGKYVKQMRHCTRCRADAIGLLNEIPDTEAMDRVKSFGKGEPITATKKGGYSKRPFVAAASMEGMLINLHLGEADRLYIFAKEDGNVVLKEVRRVPEPGGGDKRWEELSGIIGDCGYLLVSGAGNNPKKILGKNGIEVHEAEGVIEEAINTLFSGKNLNHMIKRRPGGCGVDCEGTGMGCM